MIGVQEQSAAPKSTAAIPCVCGSANGTRETMNGLAVLRCGCGVTRQYVPMTPAELHQWYAERYFAGVYSHSYEQDLRVSRIRIERHGKHGVGLGAGTRLLDIGSGLGAFIDAAAELGVDAYGVDPHSTSDRVYSEPFTEIGFPTEWCDVITMNDVLEHVPDPIAVLRECARVLKQDGTLIIDYPAFYEPEGRHHWKETEHIWLLTTEQLVDMVKRCGFAVTVIDTPIPSKRVIYARPLQVKRARVLVPSGVGDCYWVFCKLESFIQKHGLGVPQVEVVSLSQKFDRSIPYVDMMPFVKAGGYRSFRNHNDPIWKKAYLQDGNGVFERVLGCDYFLSANGPFRFDKSLNEIMPDYDINWYPKRFRSLEERAYGRRMQEEHGPFIAAFFTYHGMYQSHWLKDLTPASIYYLLERVHRDSGNRILLTGASWDKDGSAHDVNSQLLNIQAQRGGSFLVDWIGKTTLAEFFGLLNAAEGCIGFCGGNTIMSTVFRKPTVIIWNEYFRESFWRNSCPPDSLGQWYLPVDSKQPWSGTADAFCGLMQQSKAVVQ